MNVQYSVPIPVVDRTRRLEAEVAWLRAALETARDDARIAREALRLGAGRC